MKKYATVIFTDRIIHFKKAKNEEEDVNKKIDNNEFPPLSDRVPKTSFMPVGAWAADVEEEDNDVDEVKDVIEDEAEEVGDVVEEEDDGTEIEIDTVLEEENDTPVINIDIKDDKVNDEEPSEDDGQPDEYVAEDDES